VMWCIVRLFTQSAFAACFVIIIIIIIISRHAVVIAWVYLSLLYNYSIISRNKERDRQTIYT
jgi:hypothetical protein